MLTIEATAPGKAILHGEHAVVYGKAAIAASLGLRTRATYSADPGNTIRVKLDLLNCEVCWPVDVIKSLEGYVEEADDINPPSEKFLEEIRNFMERTNCLLEGSTEFQRLAVTIFLYLYTSIGHKYCSGFSDPCTICIGSELSVGAGMGSSASYSTCLTAVLLVLSKKVLTVTDSDRELISKWAFCAETICHGSPSGIDNSICTYGGALLFHKGKIESILSSIPPLKILLVDTGVPRNTKALVTMVKEKRMKHPQVMDSVLQAIHSVSLESWSILEKMADANDMHNFTKSLQELVEMNQHLLNCLGVGHPKLDDICNTSSKHGCSAKLTGAGGGGCAFIVIPEAEEHGQIFESLTAELKTMGFQYWNVFLGGPGVQVKTVA